MERATTPQLRSDAEPPPVRKAAAAQDSYPLDRLLLMMKRGVHAVATGCILQLRPKRRGPTSLWRRCSTLRRCRLPVQHLPRITAADLHDALRLDSDAPHQLHHVPHLRQKGLQLTFLTTRPTTGEPACDSHPVERLHQLALAKFRPVSVC